MSSKESRTRVSNEFVVTPRPARPAIMIGQDEWAYLKKQIGSVSHRAGLIWHTVGTTLLTAGIAAVVQIFVADFNATTKIIYWAIVAVTFIGAIPMFLSARKSRELSGPTATRIIEQMHLIENRYELPEDTHR